MQKTTLDIYGPVIEIIRKMQNANQEEKEELEQKLYTISENAYKEFQTFDESFLKIKDANMELEEKIKKLNELLDQKMAESSPLDMASSFASCEIVYKGFWDKLDSYSQKYLAMANYLFQLFSNNNGDFSPCILEFGRAVENELKQKIYLGYVASLSDNIEDMPNYNQLFKSLIKAVFSYTNNNGKYYIPAREMIKYLSYLSNSEIINPFKNALKSYLDEHHIDAISISDISFTQNADELFDKFRNTAAHPGLSMPIEDANNCREKSKKVLKKFMNAIN